MKKLYLILIIIICYISLIGCSKKEDAELNPEDNNILGMTHSSEYYWIYREKFDALDVEHVPLSMALDWFVDIYNKVYIDKTEYLKINGFNTVNISTEDLVTLYNFDTDKYYFLKPYIDCYQILDNDNRATAEDMTLFKEKVLYAIDYYINGADFIE